MTAADAAQPDPRALEALMAFWAEAGVTVSAAPAALDRLTAPPPRRAERAPSPAPPPPPPQAGPKRAPGRASAPEAAEAAAAAARSAETLEALRAAIEAFEGCALRHAGAVRAVAWRGDPATADLLVVGEAPSGDDEAASEPFRGAEGRLLDRMLQAAGLEGRALLVNTVFWRTPGGAAPAAADQAACRPFLERAAALLKPKAVLLVGAAAARGVLATDEPILKLRGQWRTWAGAHETLGLQALPTFSPGFLLAQPLAKKRVWGDLLTLAEAIDPGGGAP